MRALATQVIATFFVIKDNPGLNLHGLAKVLAEKYPDHEIVRDLYLPDGAEGYGLLKHRIEELSCVEEKEGRYSLKPGVTEYSPDFILDALIKQGLEREKVASEKKEVNT